MYIYDSGPGFETFALLSDPGKREPVRESRSKPVPSQRVAPDPLQHDCRHRIVCSVPRTYTLITSDSEADEVSRCGTNIHGI